MNPEHNTERRLYRGASLLRRIHKEKQSACFVDAARHTDRKAFTVALVDNTGKTVNSATVITNSPEIAEQTAIALALTDTRRPYIYSDSRSAVRAFQKGVISQQALHIIQKSKIHFHSICWFPAHLGNIEKAPLNLNEMAHKSARELTLRSTAFTGPDHFQENRDAPLTYNEITKHFYLSRREFATPHPTLKRPQALTLRLLQTNTYPTPKRLHYYMAERFPYTQCANCNETLDLKHMLWPCDRTTNADYTQDLARFEAAIRSPDLVEQLWAVQQAHDAASKLRLPVPTWD